MLFKKDNTETIGEVSENIKVFSLDFVDFLAKVLDFLKEFFGIEL